MPDESPEQQALSYATADRAVDKPSLLSIASLVVTALTTVWLALSMVMDQRLPFDLYKQWRIGSVAAILGVILAFASYRLPSRRRWVCHLAVTLAILVALFALLVQPL